jgi:hypothetical protein
MRSMTGRAVAEALTAVALTAVLVLVGAGLIALGGAEPPAAAFLGAGPRNAATLLGIPLLVWAVALVVAARRAGRVRLVPGIVLTLLIGVLTAVFWALIGLSSGEFGMLLVAVALAHAALFVVAALVALTLTVLVLFRRRSPAEPAVA